MLIPWVETPGEIRRLFGATTDVVVVDVFDIPVFSDEGDELDPVDSCCVFVRVRRIVQKICSATGWSVDAKTNQDIGYAPAATFTLPYPPDEVQATLEGFLSQEQIYRSGRWINTYKPPGA